MQLIFGSSSLTCASRAAPRVPIVVSGQRKLFLASMAKLTLCLCLALLAVLLLAVHAHGSVDLVEASDLAIDAAAYAQSQRGASQGSLRSSQCPSACSYRCSRTSKRKACMFFCTKCCAKCLCVPPGTYGNKQACPCYNDWKTQQGGPKCP